MNSFHFAIASVVDANTGHGFSHGGGRIDYAAAERRGRAIRARLVVALLQRMRQAVAGKLDALRAYRKRQRDIKLLTRLDAHALDDIGFTRGDIIALQLGQIDLQQLQARRASNLEAERVRLRIVGGAGDIAESRSAGNEAAFVNAKCA